MLGNTIVTLNRIKLAIVVGTWDLGAHLWSANLDRREIQLALAAFKLDFLLMSITETL